MTTRTEVRNEKKTHTLPYAQKGFVWGLVVTFVIVLALIGLTVSTQAPIPVTGLASSRVVNAWSARYRGMADYQALQAAKVDRSNTAWAARNQALANTFAIKGSLPLRTNAAYSSRLQGLADFYSQQAAQNIQRANRAYSARLQGLADWYSRRK